MATCMQVSASIRIARLPLHVCLRGQSLSVFVFVILDRIPMRPHTTSRGKPLPENPLAYVWNEPQPHRHTSQLQLNLYLRNTFKFTQSRRISNKKRGEHSAE